MRSRNYPQAGSSYAGVEIGMQIGLLCVGISRTDAAEILFAHGSGYVSYFVDVTCHETR